MENEVGKIVSSRPVGIRILQEICSSAVGFKLEVEGK